jgi:predicted nucleotidyltransferase
MSVDRTRELRELAQRIADALPPVVEEVVLTGSVSRGVADEVSDIEMLFVTTEQLSLDDCFEHAGRLGFERIDTWGVQGTEANRVFGFVDGVPVETICGRASSQRDRSTRSLAASRRGQPRRSRTAFRCGRSDCSTTGRRASATIRTSLPRRGSRTPRSPGAASTLPESSRFCGRETGFSSWSGSSTPACACCRSCTR